MRIKQHFGYDHPGDITTYGRDDRSYLVSLLHDHKLIRFRNQYLTPEQLVAFCEIFGPLWTNDSNGILSGNGEHKKHHPSTNKITIVSNRSNGVLGQHEVPWHCDVSHKPWDTSGGTMPFRALYCVKTASDEISTTQWFDQQYVYEHLPDDLRETVSNLKAVMKAPYHTGWEGNVLPLVLIDPINNKKGVCVQETFFQHFEGWTRQQSIDLIRQLFAIATKEENVFTQQWQPGDLIFYSNVTTVHHRNRLNSTEERVLWRTTFQIPELIPINIRSGQ